MSGPEKLSQVETVISPWMTLIEKVYRLPGHETPQSFHGIRPADYVTVLAIDRDGCIPLVRQFRPVLERFTLELPGGLLDDKDEEPQAAAVRELVEETGFFAPKQVIPLPVSYVDSGRLENRLFGFCMTGLVPPGGDWTPEPGVEVLRVTQAELVDAVRAGKLDHAPHVGMVGFGVLLGLLAP